MTLKEQLQKLASEKNEPCVSISLNTHRTHPDSEQDVITLKNLLSEAKDRVLEEYGKRDVAALLEKMEEVTEAVDMNYNLDSLHIFISNDILEVVKTSGETTNPGVHISDTFAIRSLIQNHNRSENYMIMLLSQSGVHLYAAENDGILNEVKNEDFPFSENQHYNTNAEKVSDGKHQDNLVREFLNKVDKALVKVHQENDLKCVVIATEDNYSRLQQVADKPGVYLGYDNIDYNHTATHHIAKQAWELVKEDQKSRRTDAIEEMQEAVSQGKVHTDLQEIFQAALDGRGDLLIVHQNFTQAVVMSDNRTFELTDDASNPEAIDDITSTIAWEVLSKKGRVIFTSQEEIKDLGEIVLKTRY